MTSHKPSLARIRHSSSFARGRNITSGSGIIHGFKYLSPAIHKNDKLLVKLTAKVSHIPHLQLARTSKNTIY
jgi:hypothetical protein